MGALLIIIGVVLFLGVSCDRYTEYQCDNFEQITGKKVKYSTFDSCYIEHDGRFMRWSEYKLYITANGLNK